eukprot:GILK01010428.1.p1 GENE.GILK01010428.1~~GILK01010428.1.p1  ORF type:complete len:501 (-),score=40.01 GILK01010428.1:120-1583(-)
MEDVDMHEKEQLGGESKVNEERNERVVINVGGRKFETYVSTLLAYPDTLLGTMFSTRNIYMRKTDSRGEYFFDRDPDAFAVVLNFYRIGKIYVPENLNKELLQHELEFWQIHPHYSEVYTWGRGEYGQLGHGDRTSQHIPKLVDRLQGRVVIHVSLGTSHSACLTDEGHVYTWGYGGDGRLGHGTEEDCLVPRQVTGLVGVHVRQVVCGELHTAAVTDEGSVYSWGLGKDGRLGHGDQKSQLAPVAVAALSGHIVQVVCGGLHTAALTDNGAVHTWGLGKDGRLGHGDESDSPIPMKVNALVHKNIVQIMAGGHHSAALTESGEVFTWGFDDDGRLGHGSPGRQLLPKRVDSLAGKKMVQIACGCWHSVALSHEGEVYAWGSCKSGQLGLGHRNSVHSPRLVIQGKGVRAIACGTAHSAALCDNGDLYTWGKHDDGRLGYDTTADSTIPRLVETLRGRGVRQVVCGVYDTAALTRDAFSHAYVSKNI